MNADALSAQRVSGWITFKAAARDYRVWVLFITYGVCFGVELTASDARQSVQPSRRTV